MNKLILPIVTLWTLCHTAAMAEAPRVVLLLTVEELRTDLLEQIQEQLPPDGLRRLLREGQYHRNAYNPILNPNATATEAIIHTGCMALSNGIAARHPLRRTEGGVASGGTSAFYDEAYVGLATVDRLSPRALTAPTISDRLKESTARKALVYSVAPHAEEAIVAGGQYADGVYWIDNFSGKWVSSTYYKSGFPSYVDRKNREAGNLSTSLGSLRWTPQKGNAGGDRFEHTFKQNGEGIRAYKQSALVNEYITSLAETLLSESSLGTDEVPDLLALHFYVGKYEVNAPEQSEEMRDAYLRLDRCLVRLLAAAEKKAGKGKVLVALSGGGYAQEDRSAESVRGAFHPDQCKALLNMYLMAQYGQASWVQEVTNDGQVYLSRKTIEAHKKDLKEIQDKTADFLLEFSGVMYAIPDHLLRARALSEWNNPYWVSCLNRATHKNRGDVLFGLLPGWISEPDGGRQVSQEEATNSALFSPFVLYGSGTKAEVLETPLDIRGVSQKISETIRIRPPTSPLIYLH